MLGAGIKGVGGQARARHARMCGRGCAVGGSTRIHGILHCQAGGGNLCPLTPPAKQGLIDVHVQAHTHIGAYAPTHQEFPHAYPASPSPHPAPGAPAARSVSAAARCWPASACARPASLQRPWPRGLRACAALSSRRAGPPPVWAGGIPQASVRASAPATHCHTLAARTR